jgi:hypothetical protein
MGRFPTPYSRLVADPYPITCKIEERLLLRINDNLIEGLTVKIVLK